MSRPVRSRICCTKTSPTCPSPGGSSVPRAKKTCTSGHGAAEASGIPTVPATVVAITPAADRIVKADTETQPRNRPNTDVVTPGISNAYRRSLQQARDEVGGLIGWPARVGLVRGDVLAVRLADRVAGVAQIDGPATPHRAGGQRQAELGGRVAEHGDGGDVLGCVGRQRVVEPDRREWH